MPLDYLQWRVYFIPDYRPNESLFVYKVHHSLADGIANILFFNDMTDAPKVTGYPNMLIRFGFLQSLIIKLIMPIFMIWLTIKLVFVMKSERNGFKTNENIKKLDSLKNVTLIPDLNLEDVKRRAAELSTEKQKVTINDIISAVLSKSLHDYLRQKTEDKTTNFVQMACPFSLRPPPKKLGDFTFDNDFAIVNLKLRLVDNLVEGVK